MSRIIVTTAVTAIIVSTVGLVSTAKAQQAAAPHKVALIDMSHVFKNYKKFDAMREGLKAQIGQSDKQAKAMAENIKAIQKELQSGTFKQGSPQYNTREKELIRLTAEFEAFRKNTQRELMRKESQIYKQIYIEVTGTVKKYAEHYNYTLVIRFNRDQIGGEDGENPQQIISGMNRQVVYFRGENDITDPIVNYLNSQYAKANP